MTFKEAKDKLKSLAGGRYHSLSYELTEFRSGQLEVKCWVYVDPRISIEGSNWKDVLMKMEIELKGESQVDSSEAPNEEILGK